MSAPEATFPLAPEAREIRGPSAFGGGLRRFLYLTWMIGLTEYRLTYFGSALGYLWSLMRPLMLFGVLYVVFSQVLKFGDDVRNYPVLLLLNIVLFSFFSDAATRSLTAVVDNEQIVRKMHFPRIVIPLSCVLTATFTMLVNLVAVFVFLLVYGVDPRWTWLLLPLILLPLILITAGAAMILSSLYVRFRDVSPIWLVLSTALFYATPVLYPVDKVPEDFQRLALANPIADLLQQARRWIVDPSAQGAFDVIGGLPWALIPSVVFLGICILGFVVFDRQAPQIAEQL
ncbi:MAG: ABC transporter permease [Actinomycetota bacterium]|nr:ABC transporter permease [Actinomycetota bacterium]